MCISATVLNSSSEKEEIRKCFVAGKKVRQFGDGGRLIVYMVLGQPLNQSRLAYFWRGCSANNAKVSAMLFLMTLHELEEQK